MSDGPDLGDAAAGDYLDALRFVRTLFDDPIDPVPFVWTPGTAHALGYTVIEVLKDAAAAHGKTGEAEVGQYVSGYLDFAITRVMAKQAGLADAGD